MRRLVLASTLLALTVVGAMVIDAARNRSRGTSEAAPARARPLVGLQIGHWRSAEAPRQLRALRASAGGATSAGAIESEVSRVIAKLAQRLLQRAGVNVELLPTTVPPRYRAAAFVSIHADGNADPSVQGFKAAASRQDPGGGSAALTAALVGRYAARSGLARNPTITDDMTGYYAFDPGRFRYGVDAGTPAVILETGFLTSPVDRRAIVEDPEIAARGIADGVIEFLRLRGALPDAGAGQLR